MARKGDEVEKDWWWCAKTEKGFDGGSEGYVAKNLLGMFPRVLPGTFNPGEESDSGSSSSSASFSSYTMKDPESAAHQQQEEEERRVGSASSA